jgi:thiamine-phosphate pyrophosphorylase
VVPYRAWELSTCGSAFPKSSALENPIQKLRNKPPFRTSHSRSGFSSHPILCYVTDRSSLGEGQLLSRVREALETGVDWVQLREKGTPTNDLIQIAEKVVQLPHESHQKMILNDRLDIALACGFDGVHLGGTSFPVEVVRKRTPAGFIVGASVHHLDEAVTAQREGANYVIFGPVFATPSKLKYGPAQGIQKLHAVTSRLSIPVLAIGGISLTNYQECLKGGAAGIAAISLFQTSRSVRKVLSQLRGTQAGFDAPMPE